MPCSARRPRTAIPPIPQWMVSARVRRSRTRRCSQPPVQAARSATWTGVRRVDCRCTDARFGKQLKDARARGDETKDVQSDVHKNIFSQPLEAALDALEAADAAAARHLQGRGAARAKRGCRAGRGWLTGAGSVRRWGLWGRCARAMAGEGRVRAPPSLISTSLPVEQRQVEGDHLGLRCGARATAPTLRAVVLGRATALAAAPSLGPARAGATAGSLCLGVVGALCKFGHRTQAAAASCWTAAASWPACCGQRELARPG